MPVGALLVAVWLIYGSLVRRTPTLTAPDKEEFTTTQFPAPSLSTPRPQTSQGHDRHPTSAAEPMPPPPPVAPPLALPGAAAARATTGRRAAIRRRSASSRRLERERLEEERRRWERLRAPQVIADNAAVGSIATAEESARAGVGPDDDPNRRFLNSVSAAGVEIARATKNPRIDALSLRGR